MGGRAPQPLRLAAGFWERHDVRLALRDRDFGSLFRLVAKYGGASQTQIAIAVGMTQGQVSTITSGSRQVTAIDVAERVLDGLQASDNARMAFGLAPRLPAVRESLPTVAVEGTGVVAGRQQLVEAAELQLRLRVDGQELVVPLNRRAFLHGGLAALAEAFALDGLADTLVDVATHPALASRVTFTSAAHLDEILIHLGQQWHALVKTHNLLGPRFALAEVRNQISVLQSLLSSVGDEQRARVVRLGAQYAESAAWLYEDSGDMKRARQWTLQALEWAYETGDHKMLAWTGYRRSQQAAVVGAANAAEVIGLARAARRDEDQLGAPMRAALRVQEACGRALDGDERGSQDLIDEAHEWAANDTDGDARGGHGSFCTAGYIEVHRAGCWLTLGQPRTALELFEQAIPTLPAVYQRDRAAALSRMAMAYVKVERPEVAARTAQAALPMARDAGSRRILSEVQQVGAELVPHRELASVGALLADLEGEAA
jgi:tetratricopeptide (TPR) repeat protein